MAVTRRSLASILGGLLAARFAAEAASGGPAADLPAAHDMSAMPAHWYGSEQIAFLIYPAFTALDMVGPHYMLTSLAGATTHVVAHRREPVKSDSGLLFVPTATFEDCPRDLDIICVPGGTAGTLAAMADEATMRFLRDRGSRARYVTSVCTGSLLLGAAGLLEGYRATSHYLTRPLLASFGAVPAEGRVVTDRNRITGGGVTAGIDFGLTLVGRLRDREYAEAVQLLAEYAPDPPYDSGTPERATAKVREMMDAMLADFVRQAEAVGREAFARSKRL